MSAGTHDAANSVDAKPRRRIIWIFGGAAAAVVTGGMLMQYFRAPSGQAATDGPPGQARVGSAEKPKMLARVGNESITYDMVAAECVNRHGKEVLDDLIHRLIIQKACESKQINVTEQEVSQEIARIADRFKMDVTQYLQMLQSERSITPMQYRTSVIWPMLALKKLAGDDVEITEEDIQKAFVRNYGPRVKARVIMLDNPRRGNEVWEEAAREPGSFEQLAQKHSIDPSSRALGGQIPPIPRYTGNKELEDAAFKLKVGEISGLIQIGGGRWVILKCEGRTDPVVTEIDEVRDSLYDELKEVKIQQAVGKKFEEIKERTPVDNYLTMSSTRPDRAGAGPAGPIQPVNATSTRPAAPTTGARPAATTTNAAPRAARN